MILRELGFYLAQGVINPSAAKTAATNFNQMIKDIAK